MKNLLIVLGVIIFICLIGGCSYNGMVSKEETVKAKWGGVQSQYQRRSDLIPNLVATVKGVANFEKSTLVEVTDARARAMRLSRLTQISLILKPSRNTSQRKDS